MNDTKTALDSIEASLELFRKYFKEIDKAVTPQIGYDIVPFKALDLKSEKALALISALREQLTPAEDVKNIWLYCPECGSKEYSAITYKEDGSEERGCHDCDQIWFSDIDYTGVVRTYLKNRKALQKPQAVDDYFADIVGKARVAAETAMRKFPQPNYVSLKIAEEAGEVVRGCVHYAEGRMEWEEVEGEIIQLMAMLYRLINEGDQINGVIPPHLTQPTEEKTS